MVHRDGEDPAAFATELEILAFWGFGDVDQRARTRMVRDRFILGQRTCGLRRHLDSVPPDTPIRDIVDRRRVWESHSDMKRHLTSLALGPEVPVTAMHSTTDDSSPCRREWDPIVPDRSTDRGATVNCELLSMLVAYLQQSVYQDTPAAPVPDTPPVSSPDVVALLRQLRLPKDELVRILSTEMREPGMMCFSCGRAGHAVSRCSCMDTAFPFLQQRQAARASAHIISSLVLPPDSEIVAPV